MKDNLKRALVASATCGMTLVTVLVLGITLNIRIGRKNEDLQRNTTYPAKTKLYANNASFLQQYSSFYSMVSCQKKSCISANKLVYNTANNIINDRYSFSAVRRLKCEMSDILQAGKLNDSPGSCSYFTSETLSTIPRENNSLNNMDVLWKYQGIAEELLRSFAKMSNKETSIKYRRSLVGNMLLIQNSFKKLISDSKAAIKGLSECQCMFRTPLRASYTQSYDALSSKYNHDKSAYIVLKQLEIVNKIMKKEFWERRNVFVLIC